MKNLVVLLVLSFFLFSCVNDPSPNSFSLRGRTSDIENGTPIYLIDLLSNQVFDSAVIRKNHFAIKGSLKTTPSKMILMTSGGLVSAYLWLEPGEMVFDASSVGFNNAVVGGSESQKVSLLFTSKIDSSSTEESILVHATKLIRNHPNSRVSVELLSQYFQKLPRKLVDALFQNLSTENQMSFYGKLVARYLELNKNIKIGDQFVDFEMKNIKGDTTALSENLGRATLLHFWASWCDSCRIENQSLVTLYNQFHEEGLALFSVSLDYEKSKWEEAVRQDQLSWTHVSDLFGRNNSAALIYSVNTIPDNVLINDKGVIVARNLHGEELVHALKRALNK